MIKGQGLARNLIITNGYKLTTLTKKISIITYFGNLVCKLDIVNMHIKFLIHWILFTILFINFFIHNFRL